MALLQAAGAARKDEVPDYSELVGVIAAAQKGLRKPVQTIAERPALKLQPETMAQVIVAAGKQARAESQAVIT